MTSDGIKVIPEGQILEGAFIKDGLGCDPDNSKIINCFLIHFVWFYDMFKVCLKKIL